MNASLRLKINGFLSDNHRLGVKVQLLYYSYITDIWLYKWFTDHNMSFLCAE